MATLSTGNKRFEVGYEGEMIGVYAGDNSTEAITACEEHMQENNFKPSTPPEKRMGGLIANEIKPKPPAPRKAPVHDYDLGR